MLRTSFLVLFAVVGFTYAHAQVTINVNAALDKKPVSPFIYGRNNNFSNVFGTPTTASEITLYKEAGLRFARENNGNNATKYNWQKKISSHPDWYNNVYDHDWDFACETIEANMPDIGVMWSFQLIGKVAANKNNNFNDWAYNNSQWWEGVAQNLAGGGEMNPTGTKAKVEGNPDLYLEDWPAESTTGILDHWFGAGGKGYSKEQFQYWNMDNEPEIWSGTHDDVMPTQLSADAFMTKYFAVAKKAREKFPEIKLVGPVPANEWQWYKWSNESLKIDGKYYPWLEYFIKRVADEQKTSGIRLLDVLDIHFYPGETANADVVQLHRIFYDETYAYPGANGIRTMNGSWDTSLNKEYIFKRVEDWLNLHFGEGHGITLSLSEFGSNSSNPNANAVLYASMLGTFANYGVEIFTPWTWKPGMWETLHLFSRYAKPTNVRSTSSAESTVSAYTTLSSDADSLTVILVNKHVTTAQTTTVSLAGFAAPAGDYNVLELSSLPASETFKSHSNNALKSRKATVTGNSFQISLPPLSITAVLLKGQTGDVVTSIPEREIVQTLSLYPNPAEGNITFDYNATAIPSRVVIYDLSGKPCGTYEWTECGRRPLTINTEHLGAGMYFAEITNQKFSTTRKLVVKR